MTDRHTDPVAYEAMRDETVHNRGWLRAVIKERAATGLAADPDIARIAEAERIRLAHDRAILIEELRADIGAFRFLADSDSPMPAFWSDWADRQVGRISATLREVGAS